MYEQNTAKLEVKVLENSEKCWGWGWPRVIVQTTATDL